MVFLVYIKKEAKPLLKEEEFVHDYVPSRGERTEPITRREDPR
jgi:hypothetical protein